MIEPPYFICYSSRDGGDVALKLADQLTAGPPCIPVWLDERKLQPGLDRYQQVVQALKDCQGVLYLMTSDSIDPSCPCTQEWLRALKYKKPIIPIRVESGLELPFRLEPRVPILFGDAFESGLARLREHVRWRATPKGLLHTMSERLQDARRDLADASPNDTERIEEEIGQLLQQIEALQLTVKNPQAAQARTQQNIERGLERERQPEVPVAPGIRTRFINRPPLVAPTYFQNRHVETGLVGEFLRKEGPRVMTVVGRGGVGKTAMVCRLLRALEGGRLPEDGGELHVDGIVYLSSRSGHPVNFPNLFAGLCRLVPDTAATYLDAVYKDTQQTVTAQMQALLAEFPAGRTIVLLDNFEDVVDAATQTIGEKDLDEALRAVLEAPPHGIKIVLTTRIAPQALLRVQPGLQESLELDEGLKSPYAENVLKAMDPGGTLRLNVPDAPLAEAREATRGFPRALEAVVGILRTDRSTDLRALLEELRQLGSRAEDVVRDLVGEAFNRLDPLAQEVMQALAVYGAPVPAVAVDYLLQPYRVGIDSSKTLARLANMQFVRGDAGRYYLHQVDRHYALSRVAEGDPDDRNTAPPPLTRYAMRHRAAEYYKETRKPREFWTTLEDLAPQLAEFELRLAGEDHDAAAGVLIEIDYHYLSLWGHYHLLLDGYERVQVRVTDPILSWSTLMGLGSASMRTGQFKKAIDCFDRSLALARERDDRSLEAASLGSLGWAYRDAGWDVERGIEFNQQALSMYEQLGDKAGEAVARGNLANAFSDLGRSVKAIEQYEKAIALHQETGSREGQCRDAYNLASEFALLDRKSEARRLGEDARQLARTLNYRLVESAATLMLGTLLQREGRGADAIKTYDEALAIADASNAAQMQTNVRLQLAWACLLLGDLPRARAVATEAAKYRYPSLYPSVLALGGVVALLEGDTPAARQAFDRAVSEAEAQMTGAKRAYDSAYVKALALAGLAVCRDAALATAASAAYRDARSISAAPGMVADECQRLDVLIGADSSGTLQPVRAAAAGEG